MLIELDVLRKILYRENAVIDENDVEPLMAVIEKEVLEIFGPPKRIVCKNSMVKSKNEKGE